MRIQTFSEKPNDFQKFVIQSSRFDAGAFRFIRVVPNSSVIIAHINGFDDRNAAETLRGTELFINRNTLPELKGNEYYQADLVGFSVVRDGKMIGTIAGFQNFGAGDIIELDNGEYVSFIGADVDMNTKTVRV